MRTLLIAVSLFVSLAALAENTASNFLNPNQLSNSTDPNLSRNAHEGAGIFSDPSDCPRCLAAQVSRNALYRKGLPPNSQGIFKPGSSGKNSTTGTSNQEGVNTGQ